MDQRKEAILKAIIHDYVKSAEPVASRRIAKEYSLGVSSATIRNEMYDLETLGFLTQPHSSAGRIPTLQGYRYYVDTILRGDTLSKEDQEKLHSLWIHGAGDIVDFMQQTARFISEVSHNMSMCFAPVCDITVIRYIHLLLVGETRGILVVVTDCGALDNEPVFFDEPVLMQEVEAMSLWLTEKYCNRSFKEISTDEFTNVFGYERDTNALQKVLYAFRAAVFKRRLLYSVGTPALLRQPEFHSVERVEPILQLLEKEEALTSLIAQDTKGPITVRIGTENANASMHNYTLIQADFLAENEAVGTIVVLGPTRMEYQRILGMLRYMQRFIQSTHLPET